MAKSYSNRFKSKEQIRVIEGTLKWPEKITEQDFSEADAWDLANSMLRSWLLNVIDPKLHLNVAYIETAHEIWQNLEKRYSVVNLLKIHQLKATIANCKQATLDVGDFYNKLTALRNGLNNHVKVPMCTCKGCDVEQ